MKRGGWVLWGWVGVVFLLLLPQHPVSLHHSPQSAGERLIVGQCEFVCTWSRVLPAVSTAFPRSRAGPLESFVTHSGFSILDDVGPPWVEYRGPPGAPACSRPWVRCKAASQAGSVSSRQSTFPAEIPALQPSKPNSGFFNRL